MFFPPPFHLLLVCFFPSSKLGLGFPLPDRELEADTSFRYISLCIRNGDFGSVFCSGGGSSFSSLGFSLKTMAPVRRNRKEGTSQIGGAVASGHADRLVQGTNDYRSEQISAGLSLGDTTNISLSKQNKPSFSGKPHNEHDPLLHDAVSTLSSLKNNPSVHPSKVLENALYGGVSYSGPVGESEAMRKWKEMKQNGFLSHPHGGMPTQPTEPVKKKRVRRQTQQRDFLPLHAPGGMPLPPPQHGKGSISLSHPPGGMPIPPSQCTQGSSFISHPQRGTLIPPPESGKQNDAKQSKRKEADIKRNTDTAKREQADKFKSAPPSGLLSGLNIGLIRRIRNQKEVRTFLEAVVQPEKTDAHIQNKLIIQVHSGSEGNEDPSVDQNQFTQPINRMSILQVSEQKDKIIASDNAEERFHPQNAVTSPRSPVANKILDQNQFTQPINRTSILQVSEQRDKILASDNAEGRFDPQNAVTSPRLSVANKRLTSSVTAPPNIASRPYGADFTAKQAPSLPLSSEWRSKPLESNDGVDIIRGESATGSLCVSDHNKKLPSTVTTASENVTEACGSDFSVEQDNMFSLTKKGATYAFQWLEFLHKDIKGRLATLRRSKERVKQIIYRRLPDLASSELPHWEAGSMFWQRSGAHCFSRWMGMFSKFYAKLCEDEKLLEKSSKEIQVMLLQCESGLRFVKRDELQPARQFGSPQQFRRSTNPEDLAALRAAQAAAAAIYSTCSFVVRKSDPKDAKDPKV